MSSNSRRLAAGEYLRLSRYIADQKKSRRLTLVSIIWILDGRTLGEEEREKKPYCLQNTIEPQVINII
jgi:hypothetical protein